MQGQPIGLGKRLRTVAVAVLGLCAVDAFAGPYWDAFFQIAHDDKGAQPDRRLALDYITEIREFWRALQFDKQIDGDIDKTLADVKARAANLDAGNLYEVLPARGRSTEWRGIGIQGGIVGSRYAFNLEDPAVDAWAKSRPEERPALWGKGSRFGDLAARIFVFPGERSIYRFTTENRFHMGRIPSRNVPRLISHLMQAAEQDARSAPMPEPAFLKRHPLPPGSARIAASYARDFPEVFRTVARFLKISKIGEVSKDGSHLLMDLTLTIDVEAFEKDFPALAELFEKLEDVVTLRSSLRDGAGRLISQTTFNSSEMTLGVRFATRDGKVLPCDESWRPVPAPAISITEPGNLEMTNHVDLHLNINGLHIDMRGIDSRIRYTMSRNGPLIHGVMNEPPRQVSASGFVMGFIPLWLIDLFIPSNIEDITRDFLTTMAKANSGAGSSLRLGALDDPRMERDVWLLTDAEVLGNGMIRFAMSMQRHLAGTNEELLADFKKLQQLLWNAFQRDLERIKAQGA